MAELSERLVAILKNVQEGIQAANTTHESKDPVLSPDLLNRLSSILPHLSIESEPPVERFW
jgi:hypothetical protein